MSTENKPHVGGDVLAKHEGITGQEFVPLDCDSCGDPTDHRYEIIADTPLGELLNLDPEGVAVETEVGVQYVEETTHICERCLSDLIEAKRLSATE